MWSWMFVNMLVIYISYAYIRVVQDIHWPLTPSNLIGHNVQQPKCCIDSIARDWFNPMVMSKLYIWNRIAEQMLP